MLNLIHLTGNIQGWGIPIMKLSYFNYLGNNNFVTSYHSRTLFLCLLKTKTSYRNIYQRKPPTPEYEQQWGT